VDATHDESLRPESVQRLVTLLAAHAPYDGVFELRLPGVWVVRRSRPDREMVRGTVPPAFCVVAQGGYEDIRDRCPRVKTRSLESVRNDRG
jgi:hypothetical protein